MVIKNLDMAVTTIEGEPFQEIVGTDADGKNITQNKTVRSVLSSALRTEFLDERCQACGITRVTEAMKYDRFTLARKIIKAKKEIEFSADEVVMLKPLVAKGYSTDVYGFIYELLEQKDGGKE